MGEALNNIDFNYINRFLHSAPKEKNSAQIGGQIPTLSDFYFQVLELESKIPALRIQVAAGNKDVINFIQASSRNMDALRVSLRDVGGVGNHARADALAYRFERVIKQLQEVIVEPAAAAGEQNNGAGVGLPGQPPGVAAGAPGGGAAAAAAAGAEEQNNGAGVWPRGQRPDGPPPAPAAAPAQQNTGAGGVGLQGQAPGAATGAPGGGAAAAAAAGAGAPPRGRAPRRGSAPPAPPPPPPRLLEFNDPRVVKWSSYLAIFGSILENNNSNLQAFPYTDQASLNELIFISSLLTTQITKLSKLKRYETIRKNVDDTIRNPDLSDVFTNEENRIPQSSDEYYTQLSTVTNGSPLLVPLDFKPVGQILADIFSCNITVYIKNEGGAIDLYDTYTSAFPITNVATKTIKILYDVDRFKTMISKNPTTLRAVTPGTVNTDLQYVDVVRISGYSNSGLFRLRKEYEREFPGEQRNSLNRGPAGSKAPSFTIPATAVAAIPATSAAAAGTSRGREMLRRATMAMQATLRQAGSAAARAAAAAGREMRSASSSVGSAASAAGRGISSGASAFGRGMRSVGSSIGSAGSRTASAVASGVSTAGRRTRNAARRGLSSLDRTTNSFAAPFVEGANRFTEQVSRVPGRAREMARSASRSLSSGASAAGRRTRNAARRGLSAVKSAFRSRASNGPVALITIAGEEVILDEAVFDPSRPQNIGRVSFVAKYMPQDADEATIELAKSLFIKVFGKLKKGKGVDPILTPGPKFPRDAEERQIIKDAISTRIETIASEILRARAARQGMISIDIAKKVDTLEILKAIEDKIEEEEAAGIGTTNTDTPVTPDEEEDQRLLKRLLALYGQRRGAAPVQAWSANVDTIYGILKKDGWDNSQVDGSLQKWSETQPPLSPYLLSVIETIRSLGPDVTRSLYDQYISNVRSNMPDPLKGDFETVLGTINESFPNDIPARMIEVTKWLIGRIQQRGGDIAAANARQGELQAELNAAKAQLEGLQRDLAAAKAETAAAADAGTQAAAAATATGDAARAEAAAAAQASITGLREQIARLQADLAAATEAGAAAEGEKTRLEAAVAAAESTAATANQEKGAAQASLAALTAEHDRLAAENERINASIAELRTTLASRAAGAGAAAVALQRQLETLEADAAGKQARINELQQQITAAQAAAASAQAGQRTAEGRATAAEAAAEDAAAGARRSVEAAEAAAAAAAAAAEAKNGELADLRAQLAAAQAAAAAVGTERGAKEAAERRVAELQASINAALEQAAAAQKAQQETQAALEAEKRKLAPAVAAATAVERQKQQGLTADAIAAAGQASQSQIRELQGRLRSLTDELNAAKAALTEVQGAAGTVAAKDQQLNTLRGRIGALQDERNRILFFLNKIKDIPNSPPNLNSAPSNVQGPLSELIAKLSELKAGRTATLDQNICFLIYFISYYVRAFLLKNTPADAFEKRKGIYRRLNENIITDILEKESNVESPNRVSLETILQSLHTILQTIDDTTGATTELKYAIFPPAEDGSVAPVIKYLVDLTTNALGSPVNEIHREIRSVVQDSLKGLGMATPTAYIQSYIPDQSFQTQDGSTRARTAFFVYKNAITSFGAVRTEVRGIKGINAEISKMFNPPGVNAAPLFLTYEYCYLLFILLSRKYLLRRAKQNGACYIPRYVVDLDGALASGGFSTVGPAAPAAEFGFGGPGESAPAAPLPPPQPPAAPLPPPPGEPPAGAAAAAQRHSDAQVGRPASDPKAPIEIPTLETNEKTFFAIFHYLDTRGTGSRLSDAIVKDLSPYIDIRGDKRVYIENNIQKFPVAVLLRDYGTSQKFFEIPDTINIGGKPVIIKDITSFTQQDQNTQKLVLKKIIEIVYDNYGNTVPSEKPVDKIRRATQSVYEFMLDLFRAYYYQYSIIGVEPENKFDAVYGIFEEVFLNNNLDSKVNTTTKLPLDEVLGITKDILADYINTAKYPPTSVKRSNKSKTPYPAPQGRAIIKVGGIQYTGGGRPCRRTRRKTSKGVSKRRSRRRTRTAAQD